MSILRYAARNVGLKHGMRKGMRALERYDISNRKMVENVRMFADSIGEHGGKGTIFIPASVLKKNHRVLNIPNRENVEIGCHGYMHVDYTSMSQTEQRKHLELCIAIFNEYGIEKPGFRAPYGRINDELARNLSRLGFAYDSSSFYVHKTIKAMKLDRNTRDLVHKRYATAKNPAPVRREGLLTIPVFLPDDEIMVDRMNMSPPAIAKVWESIVLEVSENGGIFVLQLHPIRIRALKNVLKEVLSTAAGFDFKLLSLSEVADAHLNGKLKTSDRILCATGDIDAMKITELLK